MPTYFKIPHDDKEAAKQLGARWNADYELWYAPDVPVGVDGALAARWQRTEPAIPIDTFPGEDRTFGGSTLGLDLIPSTCWFTNVRSCVAQADWKRIAMGVRKRANKHCELCGSTAVPAEKIYLDAHERFEYVDGVQVLRRLLCACSKCHLVLHFGHARATGQEDVAREHMAKVNGWDDAQVETAINGAFAEWAGRSRSNWVLDLSIIEATGVVVRLPTVQQRESKGVNLDTVHPPGQDSETFMRALGLM